MSAGSRGGYVLLDALLALFIVLAGFMACLGAVSLAGRMAERQAERVIRTIEERNFHAMESALYQTRE